MRRVGFVWINREYAYAIVSNDAGDQEFGVGIAGVVKVHLLHLQAALSKQPHGLAAPVAVAQDVDDAVEVENLARFLDRPSQPVRVHAFFARGGNQHQVDASALPAPGLWAERAAVFARAANDADRAHEAVRVKQLDERRPSFVE